MIGRYRRELSVALTFGLLLLALRVAAPRFYEGDKLPSILVSSAPILVTAVGMTLVILARQIDISIGSQFSVCGIVAALLARAGVPMPLVLLATLLTGAGFGALNGILVAGLRLPSIVVTLATLVILREGLRWLREGETVTNLPANFQWLGLGQATGQWLIVGVAAGLFLAFGWALAYLPAGRAVYATGSDPEAAWLAGIRPRRVLFGVFVLMGVLTALAALLNAIRFPDVQTIAGSGLELEAIAAVVVGGVAISGGRGTLIGPLFGVLLLATIGPALVFFGVEAYWQKAIQGAIILLAVAADALNLRRRKDAGAGLATS